MAHGGALWAPGESAAARDAPCAGLTSARAVRARQYRLTVLRAGEASADAGRWLPRALLGATGAMVWTCEDCGIKGEWKTTNASMCAVGLA